MGSGAEDLLLWIIERDICVARFNSLQRNWTAA